MPSLIIQEFIPALDEEIKAIKKGKGGSVLHIFNGRYLREVSGLHVYVFNIENFLATLDDTPAEVEIRGNDYRAQIILTQGLQVEIGIEQFCGNFITQAKLKTNLWYLLELLKKKYTEHQDGAANADFALSEDLFAGNESELRPTIHAECTNCGTQNRIETYSQDYTYLCGGCETPLEIIRYSQPDPPLNDAQKKAVTASFNNNLSIIWGPPGTGKTRTIAAAIEAHLSAGRRVLLVSHANNAVDEALEKVASQMKATSFYNEGKLIRLGISQHEHLEKLEKEYPLVLIDKIAEKLGETLTEEKIALESEKVRFEEVLDQFDTIFKSVQESTTLSSELEELESEIIIATRQRENAVAALRQLEAINSTNEKRLIEAMAAGAVKRFFKRLDPRNIQREIDQTCIAADGKKRIVGEQEVRLNRIKNSYSVKEAEVKSIKKDVEILLGGLGFSIEELEIKGNEYNKGKDIILSRIAEINKQLDEIQKRILSEARLVATTLTKTFVAKQFPDTPFDVLILDEASMAPLPHLYWATGRCRQSVTIVGDFLQLPPICISDKTMARKWLSRSIYDVLGIIEVDTACKDSRVRLLDTQYRMHPEISEISNNLFYRGKLKDAYKSDHFNLDDGISTSPLVLVETGAMNPWCSRLSTKSRFNLYNALVCVTLAKKIIDKKMDSIRKNCDDPNAKIGIVTPYSAQARLINKIAEDQKISEFLRISTIHKFQGGEEPIIIFDSCEGAGTRVALMLDDTNSDSDARRVLNVAITRAKNRLYFVGHTNHLLSGLGRDSALAGIIRYFSENAEIIGSEDLVDSYLTTDFEKWAKALLPIATATRKPVSGDRFTEKNFWNQFFGDLKEVKERLIILSPFVSLRRSGMLTDYFRAMRNRGVDIKIYTRPQNQQIGEMASQAEVVIEQLRSIGVKVIERPKMHQKIAIIDNEVLWEGSLNILSHRDTGEHMRRFEGKSTIEETINDLELNDENAAGNISEEKCPECGMPMIIRKGRYGTFLSCSKYPKCRGKMDISETKSANILKNCPECGKPMILRRGKRGTFWGCSGYPLCKETSRI